jgi:o-succinylbenzoate---CoA ligase
MLRILPDRLPPITDDLSLYEQESLQFCRDWAEGKEEFILHTSGSTGQPKPITLSRQQMQASARMTGKALQLQSGDRALVCLNTRYIAGTMMLVRGMELGMDMMVIEPSSHPLQPFPADAHFDFTALVPLQLETILTQSPEKLPLLQRMKAIIVGGAPVSYALEETLQRVSAPVYSTYGMTETVSHVALRRLNGSERSEVYTLLEGVHAGVDQRGCLWVSGPVTGYQTVQTNDLVEWSGTTTFRWLGRADNVINSGGVKIQLEKIEQQLDRALHELKIHHRFLAFGLPHPTWGQMLCVAIESPPFPPNLEQRLKQALSKSVGRYEVPRQFFYCPSFPETPTGKMDRKKVITLFAQQLSDQQ